MGGIVACILCGSVGTILVDADTAELHCSECGDDFHADDVDRVIEAWQRILPWVRSHPALVARHDALASAAPAPPETPR